MAITPDEAAYLRTSGARLYEHCKVAFAAALILFAKNYHIEIDGDDAIAYIDKAWNNTNLDETFHRLGSFGYRQLMRSGWTPYQTDDDANWTPYTL